MASYTEKMEDTVFWWGELDEYDGDYSALIDAMNSQKFFRTFGDALLDFLQKSNPDVTEETAVKYIKQRCEESGVPCADIARSPNTMKDWFRKDVRPRKSDTSRRSMFAIAFALRLTPQQTADLFHKVYLDRAFDFRSQHEIVYYFCLQNHKTWDDAQRLIDYLWSANYEKVDHTVATIHIKAAVQAFSDEKALTDYVLSHGHNLEQKTLKAKAHLEELIRDAANIVEEETSLEARRNWAQKTDAQKGEFEDEHSVMAKYRKCDADSNNHIYEVITEQRVHDISWSGTRTVFHNARLPDEIRKRFPEAGTFSKKNPTYEEQRKLIILLASYIHWYKSIHPEKYRAAFEPDFDSYIEWIDGYLTDCGFAPMYYGNPYDWLFMCCALSPTDPLDRFRNILADVLLFE